MTSPLLVEHDRAVGDREDQVGAVAAVAVPAGALPAVLGSTGRAVVVVDQRRDVGVDAQDHAAAGTAVAAVRTAERLELLAVDAGHTVAAATGVHVQHDPVHERGDRHETNFHRARQKNGQAPCRVSRAPGEPGSG